MPKGAFTLILRLGFLILIIAGCGQVIGSARDNNAGVVYAATHGSQRLEFHLATITIAPDELVSGATSQ